MFETTFPRSTNSSSRLKLLNYLHFFLFVIHVGFLIKIMKALNMFDFVEHWLALTKEKEKNKIWDEYWNVLPRRLKIRSSPSFISSTIVQNLKEKQKQYLLKFETMRKHSIQEICFHSSSSLLLTSSPCKNIKEKEKENMANQQRVRDKLESLHIHKLMVLSPGGLRVSYMMGTVMFMYENIDFESFAFSGASAGAWCSLFLCYRKDLRTLMLSIFADLLPVKMNTSIFEEMMRMKEIILKYSSTSDYDLNRLFIGVVRFDYLSCQTSTKIHCEFSDLEDAINCCVASSNIPFITGKWNQTYQNEIAWDGGFSNYPYLNLFSPSFVFLPDIWQHLNQEKGIENYTSMFSFRSLDFLAKFWQGYNDCMIHRNVLSYFFSLSSLNVLSK